MSTLLEVMTSRRGIQELPSSEHNDAILAMFAAVGHPEVNDDETAWCAACVGSALVECGLPTPPRNVNLMARSFLSYGVAYGPKPGAIAVWPRGKSSWQGHVNVVERVLEDGRVVCIGGNQNNAVTRTKPLDPATALDFRMPIAATVQDLRRAGSSEVKKADRLQNGGWIVTAIPAAAAAAQEVLAPVPTPVFTSLPEQLTFWEQCLKGAAAVAGLMGDHPWIAGTIVLGVIAVLAGRQLKQARLAKHEAGVPLSNQVVGV